MGLKKADTFTTDNHNQATHEHYIIAITPDSKVAPNILNNVSVIVTSRLESLCDGFFIDDSRDIPNALRVDCVITPNKKVLVMQEFEILNHVFHNFTFHIIACP